MKVLREWFIEAPWGKIALISWGDPSGEPILLVHGRQDSAATFIPLLEHLPDKFYYVGVDLPGNGRSDAFPIGVKLSRFHFLAAVEAVVEHLKWQQFIYIGHSMGCEQGLFYNAVYPNRIKKFVHLDAGPSLQRLQVHNLEEYYNTFYKDYYDNYHRYNNEFKTYKERDVVKSVMRARELTEEQAKIILSRNLIRVDEDLYRLSWDMRLRNPAPQNFPVEYYIELFSLNTPPSLLISAKSTTGKPYLKGKEDAQRIINQLQNKCKYFKVISVDGGHDVHITNPERFSSVLVEFLEYGGKSKL